MAEYELILGDCLEHMRVMEAGSVDAVVTDPPYSTPTVSSFGRKVVRRLSDLAIQETYFGIMRDEFERILKPAAPILVFCDDTYYPVLFSLFYSWQQTNLVIWDKGQIGMGNPFRRQHELIFYANRESIELNKECLTHIPSVIRSPITKEFHGAEKPIGLLSLLISGLTIAGDLIMDPFAGSGSTGVAALKLRRRFLGVELDPSYHAIAEKRIREAAMQPPLFVAEPQPRPGQGGLFEEER